MEIKKDDISDLEISSLIQLLDDAKKAANELDMTLTKIEELKEKIKNRTEEREKMKRTTD